MHPTHLVGGGLLIAVLGWFAVRPDGATTPLVPPPPPVADGHYTLVVEGDRDALTITHAVGKTDPWGGVAKGLESPWHLRIHAGKELLADVPLDLTPFDTRPDRKGGAVAVEGCIVQDPRVAMLVSVPRFAVATSYTFVRREANGDVPLGVVDGGRVRELAGGGR